MTSIVITPFDPDHAEELAGFIENELDNADFEGELMPSLICIEDVTAIKRQRDSLLIEARAMIASLKNVAVHPSFYAKLEALTQEKA